jgi:hypothetical protein
MESNIPPNDRPFEEVKHMSPAVIVLFPLIFISIFTSIIYFVLNKNEKDLKNKLRIIIFILLQFFCLPLLMIFFIVNSVLIFASYIFCKKLIYISTKNTLEFFSWLCEKIKCQRGVKTIVISKKQNSSELPERASRYKDVADASKDENSKQNMNLNLNNKNLFQTQINRPAAQPKKKGKIMEFLSKNILSDDNTPVYINLIKKIKNNTKNKFNQEKNNNTIVVNI